MIFKKAVNLFLVMMIKCLSVSGSSDGVDVQVRCYVFNEKSHLAERHYHLIKNVCGEELFSHVIGRVVHKKNFDEYYYQDAIEIEKMDATDVQNFDINKIFAKYHGTRTDDHGNRKLTAVVCWMKYQECSDFSESEDDISDTDMEDSDQKAEVRIPVLCKNMHYGWCMKSY